MKYRSHRGGLADSMATVVEFDTKEKLLAILDKESKPFRWAAPVQISFDHAGFDDRIGWNTYYVVMKTQSPADNTTVVLGMMDGPLPTAWFPVRFERSDDVAEGRQSGSES